MTLRILDTGLHTLVVDYYGRPNHRGLGVPVGGAADPTSLLLGNALLGNAANAAALEFTLKGPIVEALCDLACVLYGAPFDLQCTGQRLRAGTTFTQAKGDRLKIGGVPQGSRGYLCVAGGIQTRLTLGSRSSFAPVAEGAELKCFPGRIGRQFIKPHWAWEEHRKLARELGLVSDEKLIRVVDGLQAKWFAPQWPPLDRFGFLQACFTVSPASNRMGIRLQGSPLPAPNQEMVSEPVCPGTVQATGDGQCIILGVDGQTIGGYPKIAQVISADLDMLGQLRPHERIRFQRVSLADAERLYKEKQAVLHEWSARLRAASSVCLR